MSAGSDSAGDIAPPAEPAVAQLVEERARLQAEIDAMRADLTASRRRRAVRARGIVAAGLVAVTSIVFTVAVVGVWARRNALNTDRWVETVGPIADDPAVQDALGSWITTETMRLIDPEALFESVLPERGQALAAPLSSALRGFVTDEVDAFLATDTFHRLWLEINRRAHERVVDALEGDLPPSLQIEGDNVVFNAVPVVNEVLAQIGQASPEIFGRTVDLPTISVDDVPSAAVTKLEDAFGRDLPSDFGQFRVFEARRLRQAQRSVTLFNRFVVVAAIVTVALIALTLWVSPRRRRTLLQLLAGISLGVVLVRRLGLRLEGDVVELVRPENRDAARVAVDAFVSSLLDAAAWILGIAAAIAVVAVLTGPYARAVALRRRTVSVARSSVAVARTALTHRPDERTVAWVASRTDALRLGGIVVGIVGLLAIDLSWLGLLLLLAVVAGFELGVQRVAELAPLGEPSARGPVVEPTEPAAPPPSRGP